MSLSQWADFSLSGKCANFFRPQDTHPIQNARHFGPSTKSFLISFQFQITIYKSHRGGFQYYSKLLQALSWGWGLGVRDIFFSVEGQGGGWLRSPLKWIIKSNHRRCWGKGPQPPTTPLPLSCHYEGWKRPSCLLPWVTALLPFTDASAWRWDCNCPNSLFLEFC